MRCLIISAVLHVTVFAAWKVGKDHFISPKFTFLDKILHPKIMQTAALPMQKELEKQLQAEQMQVPAQLVFVEVDPQQPVVEPPKETKFYGAVSTRAENPTPKNENKPELQGNETKVARVLEPSETPRNLTPTPPAPQPEPKVEEKKPEPKPEPPPPPKPVQVAKVEPKPVEKAPEPKPIEKAPEPKPAPAPPKIEPKPEPKPETKLPAEKKVPEPIKPPEPVKQPEPVKPPVRVAVARPVEPVIGTPQQNQSNPPERRRPRRLEEVRQPNSNGDSMRQEGGVARLAMRANMDVRGTITGDYDARFIRAVEQRWFTLLEGRATTIPGEVIVEFRLRHDGRIENLKVLSNSAGEILGLICEKAILDPAPYDRWPVEMRNELRADYRDVKFTFHYLVR